MNETTQKRQGNFLTRLVRKQIFIPLAALLLLIVFNLIADPSFFAITLKENSLGDLVLTGNLITILDNASELVILAIGMTLPQVIDCVTVSAAEGLRLSRKGRLEVGFDADLTLFRLEHRPSLLVDAEKESLQADNILVPLAAIRAGKGYLTEQGSAEHAFDF